MRKSSLFRGNNQNLLVNFDHSLKLIHIPEIFEGRQRQPDRHHMDNNFNDISVEKGDVGVSVVIPCYNVAKYIETAINSALEAGYPTLEIVVVDDGSTDETMDVIKQFGEDVRFFHQANAGVSSARNRGIHEAKYELIRFLDADDEMIPESLNIMVETMLRAGDDCALVGGHPIGIRSSKPVASAFSARDLILRNRFCCSASLARRSALLNVGGFDESITHSEDRDLWIRLAALGKLVKIRTDVTILTDRPESASKSAEKMKRGMKQVLDKARSSGELSELGFWDWRQAFAFLHYQVSYMFVEQELWRKAFGELMLSWIICPIFPSPESVGEKTLFRLKRAVFIARKFFSDNR